VTASKLKRGDLQCSSEHETY